MTTQIKLGDSCKADPIEEGDFLYGVITFIDEDSGLAKSDLLGDEEFCGDIPSGKQAGVWVFDSF